METIGVPHTFVEGMFQDQIWDGIGCFLHHNTDDRPERFEMFYRSECGWNKHPQAVFVADFLANTATYILVDFPASAKERIVEKLKGGASVSERPLRVDALVLDKCSNVWKKLVNYYRSCLLSYEYQLPVLNPAPG